jgi:hypothetical protein
VSAPAISVTPEGYELIRVGEQELARVIRADFAPEKSIFVTPDDFRQQLGFIVYGADKEIKRHRHNPVRREIIGTPEVILVRSGRCLVDFYDDADAFVSSIEMRRGDVIVFHSGGHGFRMLEDTVLMEVKQGPFSPEKDKVHF